LIQKNKPKKEDKETKEAVDIKPSTNTQEPVEGINLEDYEALVETQEPKQGTLGEGIMTLLVSYVIEEEPETRALTVP